MISMAILRHFEATPDERAAYLRMRRAVAGEAAEDQAPVDAEEAERRRLDSRPSAMRKCRRPSSSS